LSYNPANCNPAHGHDFCVGPLNRIAAPLRTHLSDANDPPLDKLPATLILTKNAICTALDYAKKL
jgi:hypothetical protein